MAPEDVAFLSVTELSRQVRSGKVSPVELTQLYLNRIKRLDPHLLAVITVTEELALREARQAEQEIASGHYRGPLHGIPYGLKDLLDTKGIRTTWGIKHHENRVPDEKNAPSPFTPSVTTTIQNPRPNPSSHQKNGPLSEKVGRSSSNASIKLTL